MLADANFTDYEFVSLDFLKAEHKVSQRGHTLPRNSVVFRPIMALYFYARTEAIIPVYIQLLSMGFSRVQQLPNPQQLVTPPCRSPQPIYPAIPTAKSPS
jgi:hypothetical protein